jgi:hypothetical protein
VASCHIVANSLLFGALQLELLKLSLKNAPNSREQGSSWEAKRFLAIQEIPRILWNPKVLIFL